MQHLGKDGLYPVVLRVNHKDKRALLPTGVRIKAEQWDDVRCRVNMKHARHVALNRVLADLAARSEGAILRDRRLSIEGLRAVLSAEETTLSGTFTDQARQVLASDPPKAWHTGKSWGLILSKLDRYCPNVALEDMSPALVKRYMNEVKASGNSDATCAKDARQIRTIYRRVCKAAGQEPVSLLSGIKLKEEDREARYVPRDRLGDLLGYVARRDNQLAFDVWCLSFALCGVRWMDLVLLKWSSIHDGWLHIPSQHKTDLPKRVKLTARATAILDRYRGGKYVLKVCGDRPATPEEASIRLQAINKSLRRIGVSLKLPVVLTTHTARHTWTEYALSKNMPLPDIMRQLGVKSLKSFQRYIAQFNREVSMNVADEMDKDFG